MPAAACQGLAATRRGAPIRLWVTVHGSHKDIKDRANLFADLAQPQIAEITVNELTRS